MAHLIWLALSLACLAPRPSAEELLTPGERAAHLLSASLQIKWASWSQRYPRISPMDIRPCGAGCFRIDGTEVRMVDPSPALDRLPDVRVVGLVPDATHPSLLLQTRQADPIYLWTTFGVLERKLKIFGYDMIDEDLPPLDLGDVDGLVRARAGRLELYKFLTTRSASNLNAIRDELAVRLGCDAAYAKTLASELEELTSRLPGADAISARVAELRALEDFIRRRNLEGSDRTNASYCEPKRAQMWRDHLLQLRVLTEYALTRVPAREFARGQISSSR